MNSDEVKFYAAWVQSRFPYPEREALQMAEHIAQVAEALRQGQKKEKTLSRISDFLETFVNNFPELEQKAEAKQKRASREEKKKRQLSIFEAKK